MSDFLAFAIFLTLTAVMAAIGGWALMLALALLGLSVPYTNAVVAYVLLRLILTPIVFSARSN